MTYSIDWGNTLVKVGRFSGTELEASYQFSHNEAYDRLDALFAEAPPAGIIIAIVTHHKERIMMQLRDACKQVLVMDARTPLPVMNAYHSPETLGMDRLALVVGAQAAYPDKNLLVISAGTCVTYNFLQKGRAFRGGSISPGMNLRLRSLKEMTDQLPLVDPQGELLLIGFDTDTCIRSGVLYGMAAEIDGMIGRYAEKFDEFNAVLTGGDAPLFADKLKNKIFADPYLALKGLNLILRHNVPQLF